MKLRHALPTSGLALALSLSACGSSEDDPDVKASTSTSDSATASASPTPSATASTSSAASEGGTFTTKKIPCGQLTAPAGFKYDKGMTSSTSLCQYGSATQSVAVSFRSGTSETLDPLLEKYGEVPVDGWTHGTAPDLGDGGTHFYRFLVGGDGSVFQCAVNAGPKGPAVDQTTLADFCDAAKALVYTE